MQMTAQLGPIPESFQLRSRTQSRASHQHDRAAQTSHVMDQPALHDRFQHARATASHEHQSSTQQAMPGLLSIRPGQLKLLHETACPLYLDLAKVDSSMASFVMSMLRYDPQERISAAEALSHPFLLDLLPVLQLLKGDARGRGVGPQCRAVHAAEACHQGSPEHAPSPVGQPAKGCPGHRQSQLALPVKPEPRRQAVPSLPARSLSTGQAAAPSWLLGTLPMPSDPLLRADQPQTQLPQGTSQAQSGCLPSVAQQNATSRTAASNAAAAHLHAAAVPGNAVPVRPLPVASGHQLDISMSASQALQTVRLPAATFNIEAATAAAELPCTVASPATAVGNAPGSQGFNTRASEESPHPTSQQPAAGEDQGSGSRVNRTASHKLHEAQLAPGLGAAGTPMGLAQGSLKTPGVVKAWNGVAQLLQQMTPASQVLLILQLSAHSHHWPQLLL